MQQSGRPLVRLRGVGKRFGNGVVALEGLDLEIREHEFLSLLGPSGCGKSTALRLIAGLGEATAGGVDWAVVIPETYDLSHAGYYNEFNTIAVDPDNPARVVCGMNPPYVFVSEDYGATWTREIVDLSPAQAQDRDTESDDREWTSFAWGDNTPLFPGLARKKRDASDLWFRGEF